MSVDSSSGLPVDRNSIKSAANSSFLRRIGRLPSVTLVECGVASVEDSRSDAHRYSNENGAVTAGAETTTQERTMPTNIDETALKVQAKLRRRRRLCYPSSTAGPPLFPNGGGLFHSKSALPDSQSRRQRFAEHQ